MACLRFNTGVVSTNGKMVRRHVDSGMLVHGNRL